MNEWLRVMPFYISWSNLLSASKSGGSNDYERQFDKECKSFVIGTYTDLIHAFNACEQYSQCHYILDVYCDGKSKFSLCRQVKESKRGSCVYKKRKPFLLLLSSKMYDLKNMFAKYDQRSSL